MSLIYTCQLNEANPFDYLTELQQHAEALAACPERWMPWNYRDALRLRLNEIRAGPYESIPNRRRHHQAESRPCPGARPSPAKRSHPGSEVRPDGRVADRR